MKHLQSGTVGLAVSSQALLGEGPLWSPVHDALFWTDIEGQTFNSFSPGAEPSTIHLDDQSARNSADDVGRNATL